MKKQVMDEVNHKIRDHAPKIQVCISEWTRDQKHYRTYWRLLCWYKL